jgi:hypothetical protein
LLARRADRANFDTGDFRAVPATLQDGSFISDALAAASADLKEGQDDDERRMKLMHIGMLLHTFADTYAHQLFSGYNSPLNAASVTRVVNNITGADETSKYKDWIEAFFDLSAGLLQCFLVDISDLTKEKEIVGALAPVWRGAFGYEYGYDHTQIFDGIIGLEREQPPEDGSEGVAVAEDGLFPDMEDAFYRFNCYAEDLLITLYGIQPRDQ